jgi:multiple sugar transport system ATP-binding protein
MAKVNLVNLTKRYRKVIAVNKLTLEVKDKEFLVLLGPSGCGKTTTLRMIAGLEKPDEGEIYIDDKLVNDLPPRDRNVAMVFQSYALYPHMNVYDNIAFPLKMRKLPKAEIDKRVKQVSELLRIRHLLDRYPTQLSGGERQRVAIARAIIREAEVFLMDEPLSNLDAKLRVYMRAELKRLQRELGITTIYVTHDQVEAMTMADRIAIMNNGILQQIDTPDNIYNNPKNMFVAGFIGSPPMNFIDVTFVEKNGDYLLDSGLFILKLPRDLGELIKNKATSIELVLGIRPEDMFVLSGENKEVNVIKGEVYVVEPLGSETILDVKVGNNIIKVRTPGKSIPKTGDIVTLKIDMNKIHLFDKETGSAIL